MRRSRVEPSGVFRHPVPTFTRALSHPPVQRVVLDTNILVSSAYDEWSASWKILNDCIRGELTAVMSPALRREYERILSQTVKIRGHAETVQMFLAAAELFTPQAIPAVVPDDPDDDKVIATAVAGHAGAIITNDRHLLDLDPYHDIRILRPVTFEYLRRDERGDDWRDLARMTGLGA